ncbi:amidohydrolase family protein [Salibacterium sp. K-3]
MRIVDAHFHIIDPAYPLHSNQGYVPPAYRLQDYLADMEPFSLAGGVVVSGSFQGWDQTYLTDTLEALGNRFAGVTQLPASVTEKEVQYLHEKGVRGIRFNLKRGGRWQLEDMERLARNVYNWAGWHSELYVEAAMLNELKPVIHRLPAVVVDHLGLIKDGFDTLAALTAEGVRVKASGFGRVTLNVREAMTRIYQENPAALMFGTDLPSTRAPRPFKTDDIEIITEMFDETAQRKILYKNAETWYRIPSSDKEG